MPIGNMGWIQILAILLVVLLIFGASRLPALAKSVGQSARLFRGEIRDLKSDVTTDEAAPVAAQTTEARPASGSST